MFYFKMHTCAIHITLDILYLNILSFSYNQASDSQEFFFLEFFHYEPFFICFYQKCFLVSGVFALLGWQKRLEN